MQRSRERPRRRDIRPRRTFAYDDADTDATEFEAAVSVDLSEHEKILHQRRRRDQHICLLPGLQALHERRRGLESERHFVAAAFAMRRCKRFERRMHRTRAEDLHAFIRHGYRSP